MTGVSMSGTVPARRAGWAVVLLLLLFGNADGRIALAQAGLVQFETGQLSIETAAGDAHEIEIELAEAPEQLAQGLMFRREMPADHGMLFVFRPLRVVTMWMKNTYIPLDMLFIDRDGQIVRIAERTIPLSLRTISSESPVRAVLELNAGTAQRLGIRPGDHIRHPAFGQAP